VKCRSHSPKKIAFVHVSDEFADHSEPTSGEAMILIPASGSFGDPALETAAASA